MMRKSRLGGVVALGAALALTLTGCGNGDDTSAPASPDTPATGEGTPPPTDPPAPGREPVTITWWHNNTADPILGFFEEIAREFEALPGNEHVTVVVEGFQNEVLRDTILPTAIAGGTAPDIFQSWGGGELLNYVHNGVVMDISSFVPEPIAAGAEAFRVGDGIYGMPYRSLPSGFWVNMNLWEQAGLTEDDFPETLEELFATWETLQAAGIIPVAVGGVDGWPAAHWWYWTALRSVAPEAMQNAIVNGDFSDPGWVEAGELLQTILDRGAFNPGWEATSAQQGAASASGMVVLGQAAMQLMGTWDFGTMGNIYNEAMGLPSDAIEHGEFLSWFPFPQVPGGGGDPLAIMGGVDGFSVHADAPVEAAELLAFIVSTPMQQRYASYGNIPIDPAATSYMPDGPLVLPAQAVAEATSIQLWLDTALGPVVGGGMNAAIVAFMTGQGSPQDVVDALQALAAHMD